jgi:hypothetical protein
MVDSVLEQLTRTGAVEKVAGRLGVDPAKANAALASAVPALMAGLARNAQKPEGRAALAGALDRDHDGSVLDDDGYFDRYEEKKGDKILGHVFGEKQAPVQAQVSQLGGLSGTQGAELMKMLAPLVMGYLGKQKSGGGLDLGDLAGLLGGGGSGGGGDLGKMLQGGLGELLGGGDGSKGSSGGKPRSGGLGSLLSGLRKRRR